MQRARWIATAITTLWAIALAWPATHAETVPDERPDFVASLFTGAEQVESFARLAEIFPAHRIAASAEPFAFPAGTAMELPQTYPWHGEQRSTAALLEETRTVALLVLHKGRLVHEAYALTGGPEVHWTSMSVGKSFLSALIGIAIDEGLIGAVEDSMTAYVPELVGSAYDGVRIKDVLQMSSGARWNEDYSDPESDIARYGRVWASGASLDAFTASLERAHPPGTYNYYNSSDTQALGMLLVRATGRSLAAYAEEKLWGPLGMESDAFWVTDDSGMEMAAGGLQVTARDYAKLGELYRNSGDWHGRRIVPAQWVRDSLVADAPHVRAEAHPEYPVGYGYQWWLPVGEEGEFSAIGIYNQFVFVNPTRELVIVKLSANPTYGLTDDESSWRELESFELFRAIGRQIAP